MSDAENRAEGRAGEGPGGGPRLAQLTELLIAAGIAPEATEREMN